MNTATTAAVDHTIASMLDITEQGKLIRRDLRREFPGVKFSVKRGTGTAALWLTVTWEDGPVEASVRQVVRRYRDLTGEYSGLTTIARRISREARAAAEAAFPGYDEYNFEHYSEVTRSLQARDL